MSQGEIFLGRYVGKRVKRIEDPKLIMGRGLYVDDIKLPGALYAYFLRSSYSHARIRSIDVSDAIKLSGVVGIYTYKDIEKYVEHITFDEAKSEPMTLLASGKVRYVGEPVAMIIAKDRYVARDAADLISVDYEPLPALTDPYEAMESDIRIHEPAERNIAFEKSFKCGDPDSAFARAHLVISERLYNQGVAPAPMEPRGVAAYFDGYNLTVWSSTQTPFDLKEELYSRLKLKVPRIRAIQPDVGGAFGAKIIRYPEEFLVPLASIQLNSPVKWYSTRWEDLVSLNRGRDLYAEVEAAFDKDGRILGLRARIVGDLGAYPWGTELPMICARMITGPYKIENASITALGVYTNKIPLMAYRGAGRPEATYFIERLMSIAADELGIDDVEIRLRNLIKASEMPYKNCAGLTYDSGDYPSTLQKGLEKLDYRDLLRWVSEENKKGRLIGVGLSFYVEITSGGPFESAIVRVESDGKVTIISGASPHGQGDATGFAQLAADILGVNIEDIRVLWGDTDLIARGLITAGSRTITVGGGAVIQASLKVLEKAKKIAAHMLEAREEDVVFENGKFYVRGTPDKAVTLKDVASRAYFSPPQSLEPGLEAISYYNPGGPVYPFGVHISVVEIDRETGRVKVLLHRSYDDVGRAINPMLIEGQLMGGIAQAIGQALYEELLYDEQGFPRNPNLADYLVPTAVEMPIFEINFQETPTKHPHGTRGVGEIGTIAAPPAIIRAIEDALKRAGICVRITSMPVKPEQIYRLLSSTEKSKG
jgi:carbon-monoxide dehydrogenase large subunit